MGWGWRGNRRGLPSGCREYLYDIAHKLRGDLTVSPPTLIPTINNYICYSINKIKGWGVGGETVRSPLRL